MSKPAITLEQLTPYYRGVFFATIALKGRLARLGRDYRPAVEEVNHYQAMIKGFMAALEETHKLHAERAASEAERGS